MEGILPPTAGSLFVLRFTDSLKSGIREPDPVTKFL